MHRRLPPGGGNVREGIEHHADPEAAARIANAFVEAEERGIKGRRGERDGVAGRKIQVEQAVSQRHDGAGSAFQQRKRADIGVEAPTPLRPLRTQDSAKPVPSRRSNRSRSRGQTRLAIRQWKPGNPAAVPRPAKHTPRHATGLRSDPMALTSTQSRVRYCEVQRRSSESVELTRSRDQCYKPKHVQISRRLATWCSTAPATSASATNTAVRCRSVNISQLTVRDSRVEPAVRAVRSRNRLEQVGRRIGRYRLVGELSGVARLGQIAIEQARRDAVGKDRLHGREANPNLAALVGGREIDRARRHFGLKDRRHGLRPAGPVLFNAQSNCGVFTAGRSTMVSCTSSLSWMISDRRLSVKPRIAALAPQ